MVSMYCAANCNCPGQYCGQVYSPYSGTTSSATTSSATTVWGIWVDQGTASSRVDNSYANQTTTGLFSPISSCSNVWPLWVTQQVMSQEQLLEIQRQQQEREIAHRRAVEQQQQQMEALAAKRREADKKAMELLIENLSATQKKALKKHGWFLVQGGKSGKTYRIKGDRCSGNITELDGKHEVARYCVHADHRYPLGDQLLAQALSLRHDEEHVLKTANKTPIRQAA